MNKKSYEKEYGSKHPFFYKRLLHNTSNKLDRLYQLAKKEQTTPMEFDETIEQMIRISRHWWCYGVEKEAVQIHTFLQEGKVLKAQKQMNKLQNQITILKNIFRKL